MKATAMAGMMRAKPRSLRVSLTLRLALAMLLVCVAGTIVAYQLGARYGNQTYDRAQADDVGTLADQIGLDHERVQVNLPAAALKWLLADEGETVVYRVTDLRNGTVIHANGDLGPLPPMPSVQLVPQFRNVLVRQQPMRVAYVLRRLEPEGVPILIEVAETLGKRNEMTNTILFGTLVFMSVMSLVAITLVWQGVGRALSPLKSLQAEAEARSASDLTPLDPLHAPEEVRGLIVAINRMMERVASVMQSQSHFIANAAHQLRTPLSGLRLQAQLGLKSQDLPAMRARLLEVESSAVRAADLVEKLLILAKAESHLLPADSQPVDLAGVAQVVIERFLPLAHERQVDLGLSCRGGGFKVDGSAFLFAELLGNLVHNALIHGRHGGRVTVSLNDAGPQIQVAVIDDGPGFDEHDLPHLFTRFFRRDSAAGSAAGSGSGLGLAIVHEIAERYRGRIEVDSTPGRGSRFRVHFPKSPGVASAASLG